MTQWVFCLEEPSARAMLEGLLPKILSSEMAQDHVMYWVFQGKQDLIKRLSGRLRGWQGKETQFVVMCDQDACDCRQLKRDLLAQCQQAGKPAALVRIVCQELESFYLGDLAAVAQGFAMPKLTKQQSKKKYRDPDRLQKPSDELKRLVPEYQKISGSRKIGPHLQLTGNLSNSFNALVRGLQTGHMSPS
ncbi:MAG: DUF4276 family protein [Pseudomonadota bacterium]